MPILESPGAFEVVLPEGWVAREGPDREFELQPGDGSDLGLNISVYKRLSKRESGGTTTTDQLRRFAGVVGVADPDGLKVVRVKSWRQERSFGRFAVDGRGWFVGWLFFPKVFVVASANALERNVSGLAEGERIIASIAPA